jgi:hypothetical protein
MRIEGVTTMPNTLKQHQYYAGTHLALYPQPSQQRAEVVTKVENGIFRRYLEKESGLHDLLTTSSTKEKQFLERRQEHATREEMLQRLNYSNGVHYATNMLDLQLHV